MQRKATVDESMSFILDALKKSESERQRQNGPALYEMRVTQPRMRLPAWAVAIVVLLGVNLSVVTWLLLHRPSTAQAATTEVPAGGMAGTQRLPPGYAQPPAGSVPQTVVPQQPMMAQQAMAQPGTAPPPGASQPAMPQQGTYQYPPAAYPPNTAGTPPSANPSPPYPPAMAGVQNPAAGNALRQANGASPGENPVEETPLEPAGGSPDDYAPAVEQAPGSLNSHVRRATESGLPLYPDTDAAPGAGLPALHLDLHVYDASPQARFVLINMHRLREGDAGPEGERVEAITTDGAVISRSGSRYFLPKP
jgi:general secretion pathway protein B